MENSQQQSQPATDDIVVEVQSPVAEDLISSFSLVVRMTSIKCESIMYSIPCDYNLFSSEPRLLDALYLPSQTWTHLRIDLKEASVLKNSEVPLDTFGLGFLDKFPVNTWKILKKSSTSAAKLTKPGDLPAPEEPNKNSLDVLLSFSNGVFFLCDLENKRTMKEYNLDPKRDKPMTTLEICGFYQPEFETNTFYAYGRNFFLECSYDSDSIDNSKEDYQTLGNLASKDFFADENSYTTFVKSKDTKYGRTKCKARMGLDFAWCEFASRSRQDSKTGAATPGDISSSVGNTSKIEKKAIQAVWRCFYGYITSFKVLKAKLSSSGRSGGDSELDMFSGTSQSGLETVALFTGNDGFLRILSLDKHEYIKVISYGSGGLNNLQLNPQKDMMALATQDDSVLVIDLKNQTALKVSTHSSFVTYLNFFPELNKAMQRRKFVTYSEVQRIVSCSMDGSLSIIDFKKSILANKGTNQLAPPEMLSCTVNEGSNPKSVDTLINHIVIDDMIIQTVEKEVSQGRSLFVKHFKLPMTDTRFGFASGKISEGLMMVWLIEKGINIYECKITPQGIKKATRGESPTRTAAAKPS